MATPTCKSNQKKIDPVLFIDGQEKNGFSLTVKTKFPWLFSLGKIGC